MGPLIAPSHFENYSTATLEKADYDTKTNSV
jgi:hypothetical protein